jgi:hypothetical protein
LILEITYINSVDLRDTGDWNKTDELALLGDMVWIPEPLAVIFNNVALETIEY